MENLPLNECIESMNNFIKDPKKIESASSFERFLNLQLLIQNYSGIKDL